MARTVDRRPGRRRDQNTALCQGRRVISETRWMPDARTLSIGLLNVLNCRPSLTNEVTFLGDHGLMERKGNEGRIWTLIGVGRQTPGTEVLLKTRQMNNARWIIHPRWDGQMDRSSFLNASRGRGAASRTVESRRVTLSHPLSHGTVVFRHSPHPSVFTIVELNKPPGFTRCSRFQ